MKASRIRGYRRHLGGLLTVYVASAVTVAVSIWILTIVVALSARLFCTDGCGSEAASWAELGDTPWTLIAGGLFFLPLGIIAGLVLLPPVVAIAYPIAMFVARHVPDRRRVVAIGGALGGLIGPVVLAIARYLQTALQYRMSLVDTYAEGVLVAVVPAITSGAVMGWIVSRRHAVP